MQSKPIIDSPSLQQELKPGEQLLWWGKPDPAHRVKTSNPLILLLLINSVLAIILLALIIFFAQLFNEERAASTGLAGSTLLLMLICIAVFGFCLYSMYRPFNQRRQYVTALKKTLYAITNQRVIVITPSKQGLTVNSFTRDDMGHISRIETGGGWGDVSYGKPRHVQQGGRLFTVVEKLVGIPDVRVVEDLLSRTFKSAPQVPSMFSPSQTPFSQEYPPSAAQGTPQQQE